MLSPLVKVCLSVYPLSGLPLKVHRPIKNKTNCSYKDTGKRLLRLEVPQTNDLCKWRGLKSTGRQLNRRWEEW